MAPLYAQVAKNEDFKVLGVWLIFSFFLNFIDQQLHMAHGCQDACCKEGYRKQIYVCVVCPVHYFPLQLLTYIAVRINKMKEWPHWTLSGKMADQSVKTSNRQMTGFFCHDRFSPVNCVIGILRVYIYDYICNTVNDTLIHVLTVVDGGATLPKDTCIKVKFWLVRMLNITIHLYTIVRS